eukprot:2579487-Rhodomonas_salina.2
MPCSRSDASSAFANEASPSAANTASASSPAASTSNCTVSARRAGSETETWEGRTPRAAATAERRRAKSESALASTSSAPAIAR